MRTEERILRAFVGWFAAAWLLGSLTETFDHAATKNGWFTVAVFCTGTIGALWASRP